MGDTFTGNMAGTTLSGLKSSGHASGTTQSAVSDGQIIIRDQARQQQDIADLSRDPANANDSISPIFDKEKEQRRLQQAQLIGEIGGQVSDIVRTGGAIAAEKAKSDPASRETARQQLTAENKDVTEAAISQRAYDNAMAQYGTGSALQRTTQAVTAALQGLAGGNIAQALAGASAPELAHLLKSTESNPLVNTMAHAVLGAIVAQVSGNSAAAGAAGAAGGEMMAHVIASQLYGADTPEKIAKLSEEQKQTVSALATVAGGLAGGISGDSSTSAVAGGQAGKNAVENNALGDGFELPKGMMDYGAATASWNQYAVDHNLTQEQTQEGLNKIATGEGPSWGTEYKVKPYVKGEVAGGAGAGYYFDTSMDPYQISANRGETLAVGGRISGQVGIQFSPYFAGNIDSKRNSSIGLGLGIISSEISYGKDGVGFSFGVGPAWGWSGISTNISGEKIDVNGSSGMNSIIMISTRRKKNES